MILEIEPPEDEITCRRKHFYERNGLSFMHCQQVTIHNADIFHRHPADAQQEISIRLE